MFTLNLPNLLTVLRILLVPVLVVALLSHGGQTSDVLAAVVFAAASVTDALDGWLARTREQITTFGKLMDPVADKLLVTGALLCLVEVGDVPAWIVMVIITREFAVTGLRLVAISEKLVIPASRFGKAKTVSQNVAIAWIVCIVLAFAVVGFFLMFALAVATIVLTIIGSA